MAPAPNRYRFGDFSFDPSSGELANSSGTVRLQPQVATLLAILIERHGDLVSRTEIHQRLWPDTTVEFDDSLNSCVRQLRLALNDDANAPRFVETLPRRGYRFLSPVARDDGQLPRAVVLMTAPPRRLRPFWLGVGALGLAVLLAAVVTSGRTRRSAARSVRLAVASFRSDSSDGLLRAYQRRLVDQIMRDARAERGWTLVADTAAATHVISGSLTRRANSVQIFIGLMRRSDNRYMWADDIVDSYAFTGNSTLTADRIAKSVARVLILSR